MVDHHHQHDKHLPLLHSSKRVSRVNQSHSQTSQYQDPSSSSLVMTKSSCSTAPFGTDRYSVNHCRACSILPMVSVSWNASSTDMIPSRTTAPAASCMETQRVVLNNPRGPRPFDGSEDNGRLNMATIACPCRWSASFPCGCCPGCCRL